MSIEYYECLRTDHQINGRQRSRLHSSLTMPLYTKGRVCYIRVLGSEAGDELLVFRHRKHLISYLLALDPSLLLKRVAVTE
jgi:hypothetical protein